MNSIYQSNEKWRYYRRDGWYFKHNIKEAAPASRDVIRDEISVFLPEGLQDLLYESATWVETLKVSGMEIIADFLLEHPNYWDYLIAAPVVEEQHRPPQCSGAVYQGFGRILGWLDSTHLLSYHEDTNCVYTLTCRTPDKSLLYTVLDSYTFWQTVDTDKILASFDLSQEEKVCNALLVNADHWLLGIWGRHEDFLYSDGSVARLMFLMEIGMFELDRRQRVVRAYYQPYYMDLEEGVASATCRIADYEWRYNPVLFLTSQQAVITLERPIFGEGGYVIVEESYIYPDKKIDDMFIYPPCIIECPLPEMHVIAECLCKQGGETEKYTATEQQIELFKKRGVEYNQDFLAKGCLTEQGLVIYACNRGRDSCGEEP